MLKQLVQTTLFNPMLAAQQIIALGIKRETLWMALALAAVLNALLFSLVFQAAPPAPLEALTPEEAAQAAFLMRIMGSPAIVSIAVVASLVVSVFTFYWGGLMLKGQGRLVDVLAIVTWWQFLVLAASALLMALSFVSATLASLVSIGANIWELFVLSGLLSGVHKFGHPFKGLAVIVLSIAMMVVGLLFFFTLIALFGPVEVAHV